MSKWDLTVGQLLHEGFMYSQKLSDKIESNILAWVAEFGAFVVGKLDA